MDYSKLANRFFSKEGWTSLIYIVGNILVVAWIVSLLTKDINSTMCILIAIGLQVVNTLFILSPLGEYVLRVYNKGRKIKSNEINDILTPIFEEVYSRARMANPNLQEGIKLYIKNDDAINAFALGRRTIVVNTGTLDLHPEILKGIIGHEMGHLSNQDTVATNLIMGGNVFVSGTLLVLGKIMEFVVAVTGVGTITKRTGKETKDSWLALIVNTILFGIINLAIRIWALFGAITFTPMMRQDEYNADAFSTRLGYGEGLITLFSTGEREKPEGIIATLERTHPTDYDRVEAMKKILNEEPDLRKTGNVFNVVSIENEIIVKEEKNEDNKEGESIADSKVALTDEKIKINNKKYNCPNCGYELHEGAKFCPHCGFDLQSVRERRCPDCGYIAQNEEEFYCPKCGIELQDYNLFDDVKQKEGSSLEEMKEKDQQLGDEQEEKVIPEDELNGKLEEAKASESNSGIKDQESTRNKTFAISVATIIIGVIIIFGGIIYLNSKYDYEETTYIDETEETFIDVDGNAVKLKVIEGGVNIRENPSFDSEVMAQVENGTVLESNGRATTDEDVLDWYEVDYNGGTGYIYKDYVEKVDDSTTSIRENFIGSSQTWLDCELYEKPDILSKEIAKIPEKAKVEIIQEGFFDDDEEEWIKVYYQGKIGYLMKGDLDEDERVFY